MKRNTGRLRKDQKREEGAQRNEAWRLLTNEQKLQSLDSRLGKGVGAKRQRAKLTLVKKETV